MASQNPVRVGTDVIRQVSLFKQAGHSVSADTDITAFAHESVASNQFPAGSVDAAFVAPYDGMARINFSLSAAATIKLAEAAGGSARSHTLNAGVKSQADTLYWPIRKGFTYNFHLGEGSIFLYSLAIDAIKE